MTVSVRVAVFVSDATPERGTNFRIHGHVKPQHDGDEVKLQRRKDGRWVTAFSQNLSDRSTFSFFPLANWEGRRSFRIRWPRADFDHVAGNSRVVVVRTHD